MGQSNKYRRFILLLLGSLLPLSFDAVAADKVLEASRLERGSASLTEYFAVLEDPGLSLTLADVQKPDVESRFTQGQAPAEALSYGYTRTAYWLRLKLRNASDRSVERMLVVGYSLLSHVEFYQPTENGSYQAVVTGVATPFSTRPYPNRFFVFPLTLPAHAEPVFYLRLESASSMVVPGRLWEPQAFHENERGDYAVQTWYFGMVAAMVLFNLLLFAALRDTAYLLYSGFALFAALTISASNGLGKEFLWPATAWWSNIAVSICGALTYAMLLLFMRRILNTRELVPRLDRLIRILVGICLLAPIGYAVSITTFAVPSALLIGVANVLILFVSLYCAIVRRERIAALFLLAFLMVLIGVVTVALKTFAVLPVNAFTANGYQIGSALEMLMLAFVLAYRFIMIRRQATEAVKKANATLEQRLRERETELKVSHERLREIEQRQVLTDERQRLMQDMHDGLGSSLVSALKAVEHGRLDEVQIAQVLKSCIDDLKLAIDSLEPVDADLLLLLATLRFRLGPRLEASGIALRWDVHDLPALEWLDSKNSLHILRILQEAFTNVIKHADASEIWLTTGVEADWIVVTIADNGRGFSLARTFHNSGKGLSNQMRRAQAIGADVQWKSTDAGTILTLRLPIRRKED